MSSRYLMDQSWYTLRLAYPHVDVNIFLVVWKSVLRDYRDWLDSPASVVKISWVVRGRYMRTLATK